jgi:AraC family transcriptional regulator
MDKGAPQRKMSEILSYRDWYREGPLSGVAQTDRIVAAGPLHIINVSPPAGAVVEPAVPELAVHLLLRTAPLLRVGFNRQPRWLAVSPGSMIVAPPDTRCEYIADSAAHALTLAIPRAGLLEFTAMAAARLEIRSEEAFRDPRLARQIVQLWRAVDEGQPGSRLFADQVMRSVLHRVALDGHAGLSPKTSRETLSTHTLRRIRDFVEIHLAEELDVPMLAGAAGLSAAHFARAFTATTGMTPFRYVMSRRLARGRELLERTQRPTLDIALDVGFKTPSHFTSRFRREFGETPRSIRPARAGHSASVSLYNCVNGRADHGFLRGQTE